MRESFLKWLEMGNKLLLFTLNGCGHCVILKTKLKETSIPFTEIEVTSNEKLWNQVVKQTKMDLLPTFFIKQDDTGSGPVFCPTRDFNNEEEALEIIKKYITLEKKDK